MSVWQDARDTLWPSPTAKDGILPPLLVLLTVVTGLVDATSYLRLGHVFVANMTGNVVFLGFALAGDHALSIPASLVALAVFVVGSAASGRFAIRFGEDRHRLLRVAILAELSLVVVTLAIASTTRQDADTTSRYASIALLALAMGIQNATARRLAVPDLTTTVLTLTLTGIAADSKLAGGTGSKVGRRVLAVGAMLLGAFVGGVLTLKVDITTALATAGGLLLVISGVLTVARPHGVAVESPWTRSRPGSSAAPKPRASGLHPLRRTSRWRQGRAPARPASSCSSRRPAWS